ncbi:MAG: tetratricopeptide repeat protein [Bacteroidota bacterium]
MAYDVTDFQLEVIEASQTRPILVDFWAPWCGPCRVLGPVLEKLADEQADTWTLVKVNSDQNPELSQRYHVRGIPAVKLFHHCEIIDEFTGALPEYAIRQWLEKALPSENKARLAQAKAAVEAGDVATAEPLLRTILADEPTNPEAGVLLAQLLAFSQPEEALTLVEAAAFAGPQYLQVQEAVRTLAHLQSVTTAPEALPEDPVKPSYLQAAQAVLARDFDGALEGFIDVIQRNRYYDDDTSRKACIALFVLLGNEHPSVRTYRRRFDMALY